MTQHKSTIEEIRQRFDADVERFSNLETGQTATIDAPLALELIARAAVAVTPEAKHLLDLGCGAGNFSLRLLPLLEIERVTLIDLSAVMLQRAEQRVRAAHTCSVEPMQADLRAVELPEASVNVIVAGAVLHHLRSDQEWELLFAKLFRWLAPGGSIWIFDLMSHANRGVQELMRDRYGEYLSSLRDAEYRDAVFAYIEKEDTPRSLAYQLKLLDQAGFADVEVLHFNTCFAAFGAVKRISIAS